MFDLIAYLTNSFPRRGFRAGGRCSRRGKRCRRLWAEKLEDRNLLSVAFGLGTAGQEYGKAMTIDPSGDVLVAMLFQNTLDFDPGPGTATAGSPPGIDLALVKYHADGTLGWAKVISTTNPTAALVTPHGVQTDAAGNVFVIGYFGVLNATNTNAISADFDPGPGTTLLTNTGGADPFLVKLDPNGNLLWARTIGNTTASMTEERAWDLAVDANGAVYVSGFLNGTYDLDAGAGQSLYTSAGGTDAFLVKYDASGNYAWGFGVGGTGADDGLSVALDGAGNVFLQGHFSGTVDLDPSGGTFNVTSAGGTDSFLAKFNANTGAFQTGFRIGGTLNETSPPGTLRLSPGGDLFFSGRFRGTVDLNPGAGVNSVSNTSTADNIFVAGYTPALAFRLGFSLPSDGGLDGAHRVGFDPSGNIILTGWHSGTTDFDPGAGTFTLVSSSAAAGNASDLFLAKYTSSGAFLWADQFGGPVADQTQLSIAAGLAVDTNGNSYITGQIYGVTDFDPGAGTANYTPVGLNDAFLAMYDPLGNLADNAAPTATPQTRSTNAGTPVALTLGGDDGDPEVIQTLTYAIAANPGHGTLSGFNSATGQVTYTPTAGFSGTDTFTFTVTDDVFAGGPSRTSSAAEVTITVAPPPTLQVTGLAATASGFVAQFNGQFQLPGLNLYDGIGGTLGPADVVFRDGAGRVVAGSIVVDASREAFTFVKTGGVLTPGAYTVTVKSGAAAFRDLDGVPLDGNRDGTTGDDFNSSLVVAPSADRVVCTSDMARGAGQVVNVPNAASGLPIWISDATGVTSVAVDLVYDPALLNITGASLAAGLPGDWSVSLDTGKPGVAKIIASGATPLSGANVDVLRLAAAVPNAASYGASQAIRLENVSINGGAIAAIGDVAVHKAAYLGDADGSGIHSSADAFLTVQTALGLATGFSAHAWTDPRIIGDADRSGVLSAADAFLIVQEGLGLPETFVPDKPHITVTHMGEGVDPQFRVGSNIPAEAGGVVTVPVMLDIDPAATNVGGSDFDVFFDASRLTVQVPDGISAGADTASGWAISTILIAAGQLRVGMVHARGQPLAVGLREIARLQFRVDARAAAGDTPLDLEPDDPRAGGYTWTAADGSLLVAGTFTDDRNTPSSDVETSTIVVAGPPWQNPGHPCDVAEDGMIPPVDVLILINDINSHGARDLTAVLPSTPAKPPFLDPSGDGRRSPVDVLIVINYINRHGSGPIPGPLSRSGATELRDMFWRDTQRRTEASELAVQMVPRWDEAEDVVSLIAFAVEAYENLRVER